MEQQSPAAGVYLLTAITFGQMGWGKVGGSLYRQAEKVRARYFEMSILGHSD